MDIKDFSTIKGCRNYFQAILDCNDEVNAHPLYFALKSTILFLDALQVYQNKYGKLTLEDMNEFKEVE